MLTSNKQPKSRLLTAPLTGPMNTLTDALATRIEWQDEVNRRINSRSVSAKAQKAARLGRSLPSKPMDVALVTSPRKGMLEITFEQVDLKPIDALTYAYDVRPSRKPNALESARNADNQSQRWLRLSRLSESLTFDDVRTAAAAYCEVMPSKKDRHNLRPDRSKALLAVKNFNAKP